MKLLTLVISLFVVSMPVSFAANNAIEQLINSYPSGTPAGNAEKGEQLWMQKFPGKAPFTERSCQTCHTSNLKQQGQHARTKKAIKPLAPSANPKSLSDIKKIRKWLKRNCKWTLGRECSFEEKAHLLTFLKQQ